MDADIKALASSWIEEGLQTVFDDKEREDITVKAALYSINAGGKRIRPVLMYMVSSMLGIDPSRVLPLAISLELIHTYSLIHDDLPLMDNDDLRRGKPTCHVAFGGGIALLAGDLLLNKAYEILFENCEKDVSYISAAAHIACKAGLQGMVGGQSIDLDSEGKKISLEVLEELQDKKTGALLNAASVTPWFLLENGDLSLKKELEKYASSIGLAFQIKDDILDFVADEKVLGKTIGKDYLNNKPTFVTILGMDEAKVRLHEELTKAFDALSSIEAMGYNIESLREITSFIGDRNS